MSIVSWMRRPFGSLTRLVILQAQYFCGLSPAAVQPDLPSCSHTAGNRDKNKDVDIRSLIMNINTGEKLWNRHCNRARVMPRSHQGLVAQRIHRPSSGGHTAAPRPRVVSDISVTQVAKGTDRGGLLKEEEKKEGGKGGTGELKQEEILTRKQSRLCERFRMKHLPHGQNLHCKQHPCCETMLSLV